MSSAPILFAISWHSSFRHGDEFVHHLFCGYPDCLSGIAPADLYESAYRMLFAIEPSRMTWARSMRGLAIEPLKLGDVAFNPHASWFR